MAIGTIRGNRTLALAAVSLATFMTSLDNTVVNVALPSIQRDLRLSLGGLEWTASSYVLVFASLLLAGGRLADLYGRRRLFLAGTALFTAASLISGLATGESVLLAGRVLQGAGAALATPTTLAIISAMFPDARQRTRAVGAWSGVTALAVALGAAGRRVHQPALALGLDLLHQRAPRRRRPRRRSSGDQRVPRPERPPE